MSTSRRTQGRLHSVDVLRALAASWVMLNHVQFHVKGASQQLLFWTTLPFNLGYLGVTLFLVLSGFCIHLAVARRMMRGEGIRAEWGQFWKRRFWRLYPPYVAAIGVSLAIVAMVGRESYRDLSRLGSFPYDLATHLLMVHNLFRDYCCGLGNGAFWTLALEEQLYALYALYLVLRRRWPTVRVLAFSLAVALAWQCGWRLALGANEWDNAFSGRGNGPLVLGRWLQWPFGWWFSWVLGAVAAEAYAGALRLPRWCFRYGSALAFALLGLAANRSLAGTISRLTGLPDLAPWFHALAGLSELFFAAAAFVLLNRWVQAEGEGRFGGRVVRVLAALGVMSYSLYLTHGPLIHLLEHTIPFGEGWGATALRFVVMVPACIGFAALFFWLVERRFLRPPTAATTAARPAAVSASA